MIRYSHTINSGRTLLVLATALAIAISVASTAASSATARSEVSTLANLDWPANTVISPIVNSTQEHAFRLAKKGFKYEVPKAPRAAPAPQMAPGGGGGSSIRRAPSGGGTSIRRAPSGGGGGGIPFGGGGGGGISIGGGGLSITLPSGGGGGGGSSCEGCRESCYGRLHGTTKFSPCMKTCWKKYCRR